MASQPTSRAKALFRQNFNEDHEYAPLNPAHQETTLAFDRPFYVHQHTDDEMSDYYSEGSDAGDDDTPSGEPFSWIEYFVFMLLGTAMLWAWNMFLAATPYFQTRFADSPSIVQSFQPAITSVSCCTNLFSMFILSFLQKTANYPQRILMALFLNVIVFTLLAISTSQFKDLSSLAYLVFTLIMVFFAALATGFCQNGAFAFAAGFGRPEYINAVLTGNAVAGVLPSLAQIIAVLAVPVESATATADLTIATETKQNAQSAFVYFLLAAAVSGVTVFAFIPLVRKHKRLMESKMVASTTTIEEAEQAARKNVSMWTLFKKMKFHALALYFCFTVTMFFPTFTGKITSVTPRDTASRLFQPAAFIPLSFLVWNSGDLMGRLITLAPFLAVKPRPVILFVLSLLRVGFIGMYFLCNIGGQGAVINSDAFYLFVVQFLYGGTNGWLGSLCMMYANDYVEESEQEAAGGFLVLMLVAGLTSGSLLSFTVSGLNHA